MFALAMVYVPRTIAPCSDGGLNYLIFGWVAEFRRFDDAKHSSSDSITAKVVNDAVSRVDDFVVSNWVLHWLASVSIVTNSTFTGPSGITCFLMY